MPTKTTSQFISEAQAKHGKGRYDYSKTEYIKAKGKVIVSCPTHGDFSQEASSHLLGCGCPLCGRASARAYHIPTREEYIQKALAKHGSCYDYSEIIYSGDRGKITIICPSHGRFTQTAGNHIQGQGCPKCGFKKSGRYDAVSTEGFIARATSIHQEKYLYHNAHYQNGVSKIEIICPKHGTFKQLPGQHLLGKGCPLCGREIRAEKNKLSWLEKAEGHVANLYFLRLFGKDEEFYKVGVTFRSVKDRFHSKSLLHGYEYEVLAIHKSSNTLAVYEWEQSIISTFAYLRYHPKMPIPGATECFSSADGILAIFPL